MKYKAIKTLIFASVCMIAGMEVHFMAKRKLLPSRKKAHSPTLAGATYGLGGAEFEDRSFMRKTASVRSWKFGARGLYDPTELIMGESEERTELFSRVPQFTTLGFKNTRYIPQGWPAEGDVSSKFGRRRSPFYRGSRLHAGVDIANEPGTPVLATADGIVKLADWQGTYGMLVVLDHGFGYETYYGHNVHVLVQPGQRVRRGQVLAFMGTSGASTGCHIHYEVRRGGHPVDPMGYMGLPGFKNLAKRRDLAEAKS